MTSNNTIPEISVTSDADPKPAEPPNPEVLSGLEQLVPLSVIFVKQKVDMLEAFLGTQQDNNYAIFDQEGKMLYVAEEFSESWSRRCFGPSRPFKVNILDPNGHGFLCDRPRKCCYDRMRVTSLYDGQLLGTVRQHFSCCSGAKFKIRDEKGVVVFIIKAPYCTDVCCGDVQFDVYSPSAPHSPVGRITKLWSGWGQEMLTNADNFGISFPVDLAVNLKAVLLGSAILIDFAFFEEQYSQLHQSQDKSKHKRKRKKDKTPKSS